MLEVFAFINRVHAQSGGTLPEITPIVTPPSNFSSVEGVILAVGAVVVDIAGILALAAMIYSGIMYMTAGGDSAKAETAKKNLIWAVIGVLVTFLAFIIIGWINNISRI